jgi:DNA-directed RNA polymerase specialized sigma24 family protein
MRVLASNIEEVLDRYTEEDWDDVWKRLKRFSHKYFGGRGLDLDALIQDAILDVIVRKRHWPLGVDFVTLLCQIIRSKASHLSKRESLFMSIEGVPALRLPASEETLYLARRESEERQLAYSKLCSKIELMIREDELLCKMVTMWLEEPELKPREVARRLGVAIETIRNGQKRLSRVANQLREEWRNVRDE